MQSFEREILCLNNDYAEYCTLNTDAAVYLVKNL